MISTLPLSVNQLTFSQVVTDILHLQGQKLTTYKGNYDTFERTREEQLKNQQKAFEANERTRSHMQVVPRQLTATLIIMIMCLSICLFSLYHIMLHMNELLAHHL